MTKLEELQHAIASARRHWKWDEVRRLEAELVVESARLARAASQIVDMGFGDLQSAYDAGETITTDARKTLPSPTPVEVKKKESTKGKTKSKAKSRKG